MIRMHRLKHSLLPVYMLVVRQVKLTGVKITSFSSLSLFLNCVSQCLFIGTLKCSINI